MAKNKITMPFLTDKGSGIIVYAPPGYALVAEGKIQANDLHGMGGKEVIKHEGTVRWGLVDPSVVGVDITDSMVIIRKA